MSDTKTIPYMLEDGRKAEKKVTEVQEEGKKVIEHFAEPAIEKRLNKRVVEYSKPVVHRREIELVDEYSGDVKERQVESIDPEVKMELREVIKSNASVSALSVEETPCYVTQQAMEQTFKEGMLEVVKAIKEDQVASCSYQDSNNKVSAMQALVGERVEASDSDKSSQLTGTVLWTAIAALGAALAYLLLL